MIKQLGIEKVRVRVHNDIARIEVNLEDFETILNNIKNENRKINKNNLNMNNKIENDTNIVQKIKNLGFSYVTLDLSGLKSGSFD